MKDISKGANRRSEQTAASDDRCWVNNGGFALDGKTHMTGAQIRALPMPSIRDADDLYMEVPGSEDLIVQYDEVVPVVGRRFFSVPSIINAGSPHAANVQRAIEVLRDACNGYDEPGAGLEALAVVEAALSSGQGAKAAQPTHGNEESRRPAPSAATGSWLQEQYPEWSPESCWNCGGHGVVSVYSHNDFEGAGECGTCGGSGQIWRSPKGRLAMYPGGPFRGS